MGAIAKMNTPEEFWSKVDKSGDCWLWTGARSGKGGQYGGLIWQKKSRRAHRVAYELTYGMPSGHVLHTCDNPLCVRPDHLEDGSQKKNMQDCAKRGRVGGQRITIEQARSIFVDTRPADEVAAEHGISEGAVQHIWCRDSWKHATRDLPSIKRPRGARAHKRRRKLKNTL